MAESKRDALAARITEIAEQAGAAEGIEIVEVQLLGAGKARVLRIFIDKIDSPGGVTHADCETISQRVGAVLDAEDLIPGDHYTLEVSSPGVERKLTKPADFTRFTGQKAKVTLTEPVEDQKYWEGTLRGFEGEGNLVTIEPSEGRYVKIPLSAIRKANLKFEW